MTISKKNQAELAELTKYYGIADRVAADVTADYSEVFELLEQLAVEVELAMEHAGAFEVTDNFVGEARIREALSRVALVNREDIEMILEHLCETGVVVDERRGIREPVYALDEAYRRRAAGRAAMDDLGVGR